MRLTATRVVACVGALIGWVALIVQLWLLVQVMAVDGRSAALALWRFVGYFTILTNIVAALTLTHGAVRPGVGKGLGSPAFELAMVVATVMVGIVYSVALRAVWDPQGWQLVVDRVLHDLMPILFVLYWLLRPHGDLRFRHAILALIYPLAYCTYAMVRGTFDGWYAYHFLDPSSLEPLVLARNVAVLTTVFLAIGLVFVRLDAVMGGRRRSLKRV